MNMRLLIALLLVSMVSAAHADKIKKRDTIESLEDKEIEVRTGNVIVGSTDLARQQYTAFLDLTSLDPELRTLLALDDPLNDQLSSQVETRSGFLK